MRKADKIKNNTRQNWGEDYKNLPTLDLLLVQKESYKWFIEKGIGEIIQEVFKANSDYRSKKDSRFGKGGSRP